MDINQYEVFIKVIETGSVSAAAAETGYTQSAVSYILKMVEKQFDLQLVDRTRNGVSLTKCGEEVFPEIISVVEVNRRLCEHVDQIKNLLCGEVVLGGVASVKMLYFLPIIKKFHTIHPNVSFRFVDGVHQIQDLSERRIDLAIITYKKEIRDEYFFVKDDPLLVVLPPDCRDYDNGTFPIRDFSKFKFISVSDSDEYGITEELKQLGVFNSAPLVTDDSYSALAAVAQGLGVTVLPELSIQTKRGYRLRTVGMSPSHFRRLCLCKPQNRLLSPAAEAFYRFCTLELPTLVHGNQLDFL